MKILFVHPSAPFSTADVGRGYRRALERAGHEVADYDMLGRFEYHRRAMEEGQPGNLWALSHMASETIMVEALYHRADLVIIISGLNVHPVALWLLGKVSIPAAVVLTESPYDDEEQKQWLDLTSEQDGHIDMTVFTNDRASSMRFGWHLLPPSYDPAFHHPSEPNPEDACDVLMVGTGWGDRQAFLEAVNWSGVDLRIFGVWPGLKDNPDSPLHRFYRPLVVDNARIAEMYGSAKICLNFHRRSQVALTPGPRAYEVAACGGFQLSDHRDDLTTLFEGSVPEFTSPDHLGSMIRYYLDHEHERRDLAQRSMQRVQFETFDHRVSTLLKVIEQGKIGNPGALVMGTVG